MKRSLSLIILVLVCFAFILKKDKPTLFIIGDSTVRNGDGTGSNGQWGWGSFIAGNFDTTKINISNQAIGGRSSRTFITEGRWEKILAILKKGDYVIIQFGHNDAGPLDDTARARGTIKGVAIDTAVEIYNPIRKVREVVYSYGWYMRKYVRETKERGAVPVICSPVPRNNWEDGKVVRSGESYAGWAKQVAEEEGAYFIDLNDFVAKEYEELGPDRVKAFFPADHTHTDIEGGKLNAQIVIKAIRKIKPGNLKEYLLK